MSWTIPRVFTAAVALALVSGIAGCSEQEAKVEKPAEQQEGMSGMSGQEGMSGMSGQEGMGGMSGMDGMSGMSGTGGMTGTQPQQ